MKNIISFSNIPNNKESKDDDFTENHYSKLIKIAKSKYKFISYLNIPWGEKFILWRHDLDHSLNRALALAKIESEEGVFATYFLNVRSEFFNPYEPDQFKVLQKIKALGHRFGLHFDASFHSINCEKDLDEAIDFEKKWVQESLGLKFEAFSFHNPVKGHLNCSKDFYGGLQNAYSHNLKNKVPYVSDSNGYWRFRRLFDVLENGEDNSLQVLTHPGQWQKESMPNRKRMFRSVYGRAESTLRVYDQILSNSGRINHKGKSEILDFLKDENPDLFSILEYLWNKSDYSNLFFKLFYLIHNQLKNLILAGAVKHKKNNISSIAEIFNKDLSLRNLLEIVNMQFKNLGKEELFFTNQNCHEILDLQNLSFLECNLNDFSNIENICFEICLMIKQINSFSKNSEIKYNGFNELNNINMSTNEEDLKLIIREKLYEVNKTYIQNYLKQYKN